MAGALGASATTYDYPYMYFVTTDGTLQSMAVDGMTFAFTDGSMVVTNESESKTFTLTAMNKMYFSESSGLEELVNATDESVEVYNMAGIMLGRYANTQQAMQELDRGIYVLKSQSTTLKIAVR